MLRKKHIIIRFEAKWKLQIIYIQFDAKKIDIVIQLDSQGDTFRIHSVMLKTKPQTDVNYDDKFSEFRTLAKRNSDGKQAQQ